MWKMMTWWGGTTPCESFPFFPNMFFCQGEIFSDANRCQQHTCTTSERWLIGSAVHRAIAGASSPGASQTPHAICRWSRQAERTMADVEWYARTKSYGWLEFPPTAIVDCSGRFRENIQSYTIKCCCLVLQSRVEVLEWSLRCPHWACHCSWSSKSRARSNAAAHVASGWIVRLLVWGYSEPSRASRRSFSC